MKRLFLLLFTIFSAAFTSAQTNQEPGKPVKINAKPEKGFYWDYYLLYNRSKETLKLPLLVIPNNTGKVNDDIGVHDLASQKTIAQGSAITKMLNIPILVPVFPRPEREWKIYTHALDRDVMTTGIKEIQRLDLQLIAMINDAKEILEKEGIKIEEKIFILGFSASGMFANRFTLLHPELVKAAAIGSPGGMPMLPLSEYNKNILPYPIGIKDYGELTGSKFNFENLKQVNLFFFLGDKDENDSVVYRDGYELEDEQLIMSQFGKTLQERWVKCGAVYKQAGLTNAGFHLYPEAAHTVTDNMIKDILDFFKKNL